MREASRRIKDSSLKEANSLPPPTRPSLPPSARQGTQAQMQHPAWAQVCVLDWDSNPVSFLELSWSSSKEYASAKKVLLTLSEMLWQDTCAVLIKIHLPTYVVSGVHGKTVWTARKQSIPGKKTVNRQIHGFRISCIHTHSLKVFPVQDCRSL